MSASTTPTDRPRSAIEAARFTVTEDLPTPPLPEATQYTRVSDPGSANGIRGSSAVPRNWRRNEVRWASLITSSSTCTSRTPGRADTALVIRDVMVSRIGQPATVNHTATPTVPSPATVTSLTMPSSVIGRLISGSCTPSSTVRTASTDGAVWVEATGGTHLLGWG